jgi:hypothetical protein
VVLPRHLIHLLALGFVAVALVACNRESDGLAAEPGIRSATRTGNESSKEIQSGNFPSLQLRRQMSGAARLELLEKLGCVPEDAELADWELATETSWWGKPIDAEVFWRGRIIWLDATNRRDAYRLGRLYPPVPPGMHAPTYKDDKDRRGSYGLDSPNIPYVFNPSERGFWDSFSKTHLKPPDELASQQFQLAESVFGVSYDYERGGNRTHLRQTDVETIQKAELRDAVDVGTPREALSENALLWTYVLRKRQEYADLISYGERAATVAGPQFLKKVLVDPKYITEPLTEDQMRAANDWKIGYLQRLRKEKTDESYIQAYLKAWNLSEEQVFAAGQK